MKYFKIHHSVNPKETGNRFPQISELVNGDDYNRDAENSIFRINYNKPIHPKLNVPAFRLHKHAKRTDFVSGPGQFFIFSDELLQLLQGFKLPTFQSFKTTLVTNSDVFNYAIFNISGNHYEFIDFKNTSFALVPSTSRPVIQSVPDINSIEAYEEWKTKYPYYIRENPHRVKVIVNKLTLNKSDIPYDMFRIKGLFSPICYFVSEPLKKAIEQHKLSGMRFTEVQNIETVLPPIAKQA